MNKNVKSQKMQGLWDRRGGRGSGAMPEGLQEVSSRTQVKSNTVVTCCQVKSRGKNFPVTARLETRMLGAGDGGLIKGGRPFRRLGVDRQADSEHGLRASPSDSLLRSRRASFGKELPSTLDLPVWLVVTMCGE